MTLSIFVSSLDTEPMIFVHALKFEVAWRKRHELHAVVIFTNSYCGCLHSCSKQSILLLRKKGGFYFCFVQHQKCCSKFFHISEYSTFTWHCWRGVCFTKNQRHYYHDTYTAYSFLHFVDRASYNDSWWMTNVMHKFSSMCLFLFTTLYMFRAHSAHHQERQLFQYSLW